MSRLHSDGLTYCVRQPLIATRAHAKTPPRGERPNHLVRGLGITEILKERSLRINHRPRLSVALLCDNRPRGFGMRGRLTLLAVR